MVRLFIAPAQIDLNTGIARITGQDHLHLARVLRARIGQQLTLLDGLGSAYLATLTEIDKRESTARIEERMEPPPEPPIFIHVAQALGKGDKFEQVIQHGTEAGAGAFIPVRAVRSVVEIPAVRIVERQARWQAIAKGAAEQSFRALVPAVMVPATIEEVLRKTRERDIPAFLLHTASSAVPFYAALKPTGAAPRQICLLIGPEGGWTEDELELARTLGCQLISLGPHVLRTETAALVAISQLLYHFARPQEFTPCVS